MKKFFYYDQKKKTLFIMFNITSWIYYEIVNTELNDEFKKERFKKI